MGVEDLIALCQVLGSTNESVNWNPKADIDGNGMVDIFDAVQVATVLSIAT